MLNVLKLFTYVDGVQDTPFPNKEEQVYITDFEYNANRMGGAPSLSCKVKHRLCLDNLWKDNVYAEFRGEKYFVFNTPSSSKDNDDERYIHDLTLLSEREVLNHVYFTNVVTDENSDSCIANGIWRNGFFYWYDDIWKNNPSVKYASSNSGDTAVKNLTKIQFFGNIEQFVGRLNSTLRNSNLGYRAVIDEGIVFEDKMVAFENKYILEAMQEIFNVFEIPYYFVGRVIHIGYTEDAITFPFKYGFDNALLSISKDNENIKILNRVGGHGSEKNIPYYYPNDSENREEIEANGGKWIMPSQYLMPPVYRQSLGYNMFYNAKNNTYKNELGEYYTFENEYSKKNQREHIENFEEIHPTIVGVKNAANQPIDSFLEFAYDLNDSDEFDKDTNEYLHPYFFAKLKKTDGTFGFNLFEHANEKQTMQISFTTGTCGACTFEVGVGEKTNQNIVQVDEQGNLKRDKNGNVLWQNQSPQPQQNDTSKNEVWIALKKDDSTYVNLMPNAKNNLKPNPEDKFVILGITLPKAYILAAEQRLEDALIKYMFENNSEKFGFSINFSRVFLAEHQEILNSLNENSRILLEYNGRQYTFYIDDYTYKVESDKSLPEIKVNLVDKLTIGRNSLQQALDGVKQDILNSVGSMDVLKQGLKYFVRKDVDDYVKGVTTFLNGLNSKGSVDIGKNGFAGGLTGFGARIDENGNGEMRKLTLWESLDVPEIRYNSVKINEGIYWQCCGCGVIEAVNPFTKDTGACKVKTEKGQVMSVEEGDICIGIWHFGDERDSKTTEDDGKGNLKFSGFATCYFEITGAYPEQNVFHYRLREGYGMHPQSQMTFAVYGNFKNVKRQVSTYYAPTYTRRLVNQNTWEIGKNNVAMQNGDLSNLSIFGLDMTGYSEYLNSVYFTGTITQVRNGDEVITANDRGEWKSIYSYSYYDRVSYKGSIWLCINKDGNVVSEPTDMNGRDWLKQVSRGTDGRDGNNINIIGSLENETELPDIGKDGDTYLVQGFLYVWVGTGGDSTNKKWKNAGKIQGEKGDDGISYIRTDEFYQWNNNGDYAPIGTWTKNSIPQRPADSSFRYLWNYAVIVRSDGSQEQTEKHVISIDGKGIKSISEKYALTATPTAPDKDDLSKWTDVKVMPTKNERYLWNREEIIYTDNSTFVSVNLLSERGSDGKDGAEGSPGKDGAEGIQGCIMRTSEWKPNVQYRNDSLLKTGTRYIDIVLIKANTNTGYRAFEHKADNSPHTSGDNFEAEREMYWNELSNVDGIYTSLIIAKNAKITFGQANELTISENVNGVEKITAGLTGASDKGDESVRIWAGNSNPNNAPFKVTKTGKLYSTDADITGKINATKGGRIGGFDINESSIGKLYDDKHNSFGMSLYDKFIRFKDDNHVTMLGCGLLGSTGSPTNAYISLNYVPTNPYSPVDNIAMKVSCTGMPEDQEGKGRNVALYVISGHIIVKDGYIESSVKHDVVDYSTYSAVRLNRNTSCILIGGEGKTFGVYNDGSWRSGQTLTIINNSNTDKTINGDVTQVGARSYVVHRFTSKSFIFYGSKFFPSSDFT